MRRVERRAEDVRPAARRDLADRILRALENEQVAAGLSQREAGEPVTGFVGHERLVEVVSMIVDAVDRKARLDVIGELVLYERDDPSTGDDPIIDVVDGDGRSLLPDLDDGLLDGFDVDDKGSLASAIVAALGAGEERRRKFGSAYWTFGGVRLRIEAIE